MLQPRNKAVATSLANHLTSQFRALRLVLEMSHLMRPVFCFFSRAVRGSVVDGHKHRLTCSIAIYLHPTVVPESAALDKTRKSQTRRESRHSSLASGGAGLKKAKSGFFYGRAYLPTQFLISELCTPIQTSGQCRKEAARAIRDRLFVSEVIYRFPLHLKSLIQSSRLQQGPRGGGGEQDFCH